MTSRSGPYLLKLFEYLPLRFFKAIAAMLSPILRSISQPSTPQIRKRPRHVVGTMHQKSMETFLGGVRELFTAPLDVGKLLQLSGELRLEYLDRLQSSPISMLPSYQHTLPVGSETGDYLALDVGGSTLRIAVIRLLGRKADGSSDRQVRRVRQFEIDKAIRDLSGEAFFDWMASRIGEMLTMYGHMTGNASAQLAMGLSWSFPIEQTSPRSGKLLKMGKGFRATEECSGQDLSELIMRSCRKKNLNVVMRAIVNDGTATLISQAYKDPSARMSLIMGTGMNASVYLPVSALHRSKFGDRPEAWFDAADHVLVNTELSMFGKSILPITRWDEDLNRAHQHPGFQPLEYMLTGRYLGEIVRLILVDAVADAGLFDGQLPDRLDEPYTLDTKIVAAFEEDTSPNLAAARATFLKAHRMRTKLSQSDLLFVQSVARLVSRRAQAYLATALHALWTLRTEAEGLETGKSCHVTVACNGTILEKYPGFRAQTQTYLDELCVLSGAAKGAVTLEMAPESSLFGAAVAVCCLEGT
ncbi:N-acetylglucosamine kinase 1 [Oleoguttula sp. CCFEE 5521]